jgi:hypothetical protein
MAEAVSSPAPILRLPLEILSSILLLAVPSIHRRGFPRCLSKLADSPFHSVRSTCRTFRWIVNELPFWNDKALRIGHLADNVLCPESFTAQDWTDRYKRWLEVYLSDPHLQQCLSRKRDWYVRHGAEFGTLVLKVPEFGKRVRSLKVDIGLSGVNVDSFQYLFPVLVDLEIRAGDHVCLDELPVSLKRLSVEGPLDEDCYCQHTLPNVRQLTYLLRASYVPIDLKRILPFPPTDKLRKLELDFGVPISSSDTLKEFNLLQRFENLKHLSLRPFSPGLARALYESTLRLKTFKAAVDGPYDTDYALDTESLVDLLESPILRDVESLHYLLSVSSPMQKPYKSVYERFISTITSLPELRELELTYPIRFHWFQYFRNSQCLASVRWRHCSTPPVDIITGKYIKVKVLKEALLDVLPRHEEDAAVVFIKSYFSMWHLYGSDEGENDEWESEDSESTEDENDEGPDDYEVSDSDDEEDDGGESEDSDVDGENE